MMTRQAKRTQIRAAAEMVERLAPLPERGNYGRRFFTLMTVAKEYGVSITAIVGELVRRRDEAESGLDGKGPDAR